MSFKRIYFENDKEWLDFKNTYIGGTGASAIIGSNAYKTSSQYYKERKGIIEREDISNKSYVIYGNEAEPVLRKLFEITYKDYFKVYFGEKEILINNELPFIGADLDGELEVLQDCIFETKQLKKGMKGIYEGKTTTIRSSISKEKWKDTLPQEYYIQILHYLTVTDYDFAILNAELIFPNYEENNINVFKENRQYIILKEERLEDIEYLLEEEKKWQKEYFEKDIEPPLLLNL